MSQVIYPFLSSQLHLPHRMAAFDISKDKEYFVVSKGKPENIDGSSGGEMS